MVIVAECDPLRGDSEKYAELLRRDRVQVEYKQYDGMNHGFFGRADITPETTRAAVEYAAEKIALFHNL